MGVPAATMASAAPGYNRSGAAKVAGAVSTAKKAAATGAASSTKAAVAGATAETGESGAITSVHTHVHHVRQNFKWQIHIVLTIGMIIAVEPIREFY